jgi:hypothetical protein
MGSRLSIAILAKIGRSAYLLVALLILLLVYPFLGDTVGPRLIGGFLNAAILVAAAYSISRSRGAFLVALCLAAPALFLQALFLLTKNWIIGELLYLTYAAFYLFTIVHVLLYVLSAGQVTADKIHAAIAGYILCALLWCAVYLFVEHLHPGSFAVNGATSLANPLNWEDFLFYSFAALTTTGYGDIVPASAHARSLAILEQLAGTFYVAILIARLTGLYQRNGDRGSGLK